MAFAAEAVAILAIGCVAGLKGLQKVRKGVGYALVRMLCTSSLSHTKAHFQYKHYATTV